MNRVDAWVLRPGKAGAPSQPGQLERTRLTLRAAQDDEALVEPLLGSWEANMTHAVNRSPVDVCRQRNDPYLILGNTGVVRVLRPAREGPTAAEGDVCLVLPFGKRDPDGYAELIHAYDAPGTHGVLATRTLMPGDGLLPVDPDSRYPLSRWVHYSRYFTAWDNWSVAHACWRSQMPTADPSSHLVFAWGGGVALAEVDLARRNGFRTAMTASSDERLALIGELGITPVDRRNYPGLGNEGESSAAIRRSRLSERALLRLLHELSDGRGCSVIIDNIGGPLHPTTLRALGRQGVVSTCGWKAGMRLSVGRATECQRRHVHVHTHSWRYEDSPAIRSFSEATGWLAPSEAIDTYSFDDVPRLAQEYADAKVHSYFQQFRVNDV
ncbi:zinc-binding alcohol dehydrogenase family protein [Streptomyces sp. NPDC054796]